MSLIYFSPTRIVKLVKNFRSHKAILQFSNDQFYNRELQPCADPVLTHSLLRSDLVKNDFPVLFHSIVGKDEQEESSPSFFNIDEATRVKKYCLELMDDRRLRLSEPNSIVVTVYTLTELHFRRTSRHRSHHTVSRAEM